MTDNAEFMAVHAQPFERIEGIIDAKLSRLGPGLAEFQVHYGEVDWISGFTSADNAQLYEFDADERQSIAKMINDSKTKLAQLAVTVESTKLFIDVIHHDAVLAIQKIVNTPKEELGTLSVDADDLKKKYREIIDCGENVHKVFHSRSAVYSEDSEDPGFEVRLHKVEADPTLALGGFVLRSVTVTDGQLVRTFKLLRGEEDYADATVSAARDDFIMPCMNFFGKQFEMEVSIALSGGYINDEDLDEIMGNLWTSCQGTSKEEEATSMLEQLRVRAESMHQGILMSIQYDGQKPTSEFLGEVLGILTSLD